MTSVEQKKLLGQQLSLLSNLRGISQVRLAKECGISRIALNRFFRGRSELKAGDLLRVLKVLGIDIQEILSGTLKLELAPAIDRQFTSVQMS